MINFKRENGKYILTVDGVEFECAGIWEALAKSLYYYRAKNENL